MKPLTTILVSGCYDFLHGGHIQFFEDARSLGDKLIVSVATDEVLKLYKGRRSVMPVEHKIKLLQSLWMVDLVVPSSDVDTLFDFRTSFIQNDVDILAVTEDDKHTEEKKKFCDNIGKKLVVLKKRNDLEGCDVSSTMLKRRCRIPDKIPFRVDFAGGWRDVPRFSKPGSFIVNCTIDVFFGESKIEKGAGVGGSAAVAISVGKDSFKSESDQGVGWQDPAVILETGLCVWRSGHKPVLELKSNPDFIQKMGLYWTGKTHATSQIADKWRDYNAIDLSGSVAYRAVVERNWNVLCDAVSLSYGAQMREGMKSLPNFSETAKKYLGAGWGGYALYMFDNKQKIPEGMKEIHPYLFGWNR